MALEIKMPTAQSAPSAPAVDLKKVSASEPMLQRVQIVKPGRNRLLKMLVFGPYGSGKTRLVSSAIDDPRTAPAILLNFEGGESSIAGLDIDTVKIEDWEGYNEIFDYLQRADHGYKSVVIDSITETHIFALFKILDEEGAKRRNSNHIEQGDYGTASVQLRRLIRAFRDLPMNLLITALEREELDAREGYVKKPALSGRLADEIPGIVDVVGYLTMGTDEDNVVRRVLVLQNYPKIRSKVRIPPSIVAPDEILEPTVTKILDSLQYE